MGTWDTSGSEMLLSLSVFVSSKEQTVATYYNKKFRRIGKAKIENLPEGVCMTSSSRVIQLPPALTILALADSVKRSAATFIFGISRILSSSVTVATTTTVLSLWISDTPVSFQLIGSKWDLLFLSEMFDHFCE